MSFKDGDFIEIDYTLWEEESNEVLATTDIDTAKKHNIYDEHLKYGPVLVVLGANAVVKGLERELKNMNIGDKKSISLTPEDAFGKRDESLLRVMKLSDFKSRDINPYPGMRIDIDNVPVVVKSVGSGRVIVDANHPNAGKKVRYDVHIIKSLNEPKEKIGALARTYNAEPSGIEIKDRTAEIFYDNKVKKDYDYFVNRTSSLAAIFTYMKDNIERVIVKDEYLNDIPKNKD